MNNPRKMKLCHIGWTLSTHECSIYWWCPAYKLIF